jgi:hypothetical protein
MPRIPDYCKLTAFTILVTLSLFSCFSAHAFEAVPLGLNKNQIVETNFLNLDIDEYQFGKDLVVIALDDSVDTLYAAQRPFPTISIVRKIGKILAVLKKVTLPEVTENGITAQPYILDLHFSEGGNGKTKDGSLFASVVYSFNDPNLCSHVLLYKYNPDLSNHQTVFKSSPCVGGISAWSEIAGRLASNSDNVFMTGGDILTDLYRNAYPRPGFCCDDSDYKTLQEKSNLFGAVIQIEKVSLISRKFSFGHRGPHGLVWDKNRKQLYESEHGPRGGDEVNLLKPEQHYGWPYETFGRYYMLDHPNSPTHLNGKYNSHSKSTPPLFAWVPSISPSQLAIVSNEGDFGKLWGGDLILSTLKDRSLHRMRLNERGDKVFYSERIHLGFRIRDLEIGNDTIFLSTDDGKILLLQKHSSQGQGVYPPQ